MRTQTAPLFKVRYQANFHSKTLFFGVFCLSDKKNLLSLKNLEQKSVLKSDNSKYFSLFFKSLTLAKIAIVLHIRKRIRLVIILQINDIKGKTVPETGEF